jgi:hypothetical protein
VQYAWRKRNPTDERRGRDADMRACFVVGIALPTTLTWASTAGLAERLPYDRPVHGTSAILIASCAAVIPLSVIVSGAVDWYVIRPFREGVFGAPVCQHAGSSRDREAYAAYWVLHRGICEFVIFGAIAMMIAFAAAWIAIASDDAIVLEALNIIGVGAIVWPATRMLWLLQHALRFVMQPKPGLGDWAMGRNREGETIEGFLVDVSTTPGVQLLPCPPDTDGDEIPGQADPGEPNRRYVALEDRGTLRAGSLRPGGPRRVCVNRCEFWIRGCEVGIRQRADDARRRAVEAAVASDGRSSVAS